MFFTQRASAFNASHLSLNLSSSPSRQSSPTTNSENEIDPSEAASNDALSNISSEVPGASGSIITAASSPSPALDSPLTSYTDERFSRIVIGSPDDDSRGFAATWSSSAAGKISPLEEQFRCYSFRRTSFDQNALERAASASPIKTSRSFSFAVVSSPDSMMTSDDVVPKIEEVDDDEEGVQTLGSVPFNVCHPEAETMESKSELIPVSPTLEAPRRRGRPRKHPIPIPSQIKITKGRSKTGCITCRRRKKKCDESKPSCLNCQKNAVICEGYPVKEIWKSGKQKMEEAARRISFAMIPRSLPLLIDGIETDIDRKFLDHFVHDFSRVLTLINDDSNPFKEILLPMATQHTGLMHSLMCLAGSHLSARDPEPQLKERKLYHFDRAITDLRTTIAARSEVTDQAELPVEDPMIASTIALCLHTICEGETGGEYRSHMDAARYFLVTGRPKNEQFRQFIVEFFQYHDVSNALTTLDRRPIVDCGDLRLPDFVPHAQAGALLGIFDGLFQYISEITVIRDRIRQRINQGIDPAVDYRTLSDAVDIDSRIRNWEPSYPPDNPNWLASQLYRQSTWVYLYRTIRPSRQDEKISKVVDDGLLYLDQLPLDAGAFSILLMPLFLLGCSAFEIPQRERIKKGFDSLQAYSSLRNIEPALLVVEKVWEIMDTTPEKSWDWEKIIDDMHMDFLIT
ncbi:hypothetical protein FQN57_001732 [Myotisia sp. PD_48]|nr:hypothetical protein FQN57_001732 [Myotisia sp. PD_48]